MTSNDDVVIGPADEADYDWSARVMASTDPWITLGRDVARCMASLRRPHADLYLARRGAHGAAGADGADGAAGQERLGFIALQEQGVAGSPYVVAIAVAAEARGLGVGSALLRFAERRYPSARHIFLCVSDFNTRARALYERQGYTLVGELKDYAAPGYSELLMHRVIE
jgi:ribosomal protein S18 acetylase RimI-like enzyme